MRSNLILISLPLWVVLGILCLGCDQRSKISASAEYIQHLDKISAFWSHYKYSSVEGGQVLALDENKITTSEGQSYALLRAVWLSDEDMFEQVLNWTIVHLQQRPGDKLFAWKWKGKILDINAATDADQDIALALILAYWKFGKIKYKEMAEQILESIWSHEILRVGTDYYVTGGNWARFEKYPMVHVAYSAPYAYEVFGRFDSRFPWKRLVESSYKILDWIYFTKNLKVPPETIVVDKVSGELYLSPPGSKSPPIFSYDAFPIFWRVAVDQRWFGREKPELVDRMLQFFKEEWNKQGRLFDKYSLDGKRLSEFEALPLYATVHTLAVQNAPRLANEILNKKVEGLRAKAVKGETLPYYLNNWLWFDYAFQYELIRNFDEFLGFLRPFDLRGFANHFPLALFALGLLFYFLSKFVSIFKYGFLLVAIGFCIRYLHWRLFNSLNFVEELGPLISISLWLAEAYCFTTILLMLVQVGVRETLEPEPSVHKNFSPSVDIFIPIYSESDEILEKTVIAAMRMDYPNKTVFVCDDSHRPSVPEICKKHGAKHILGPKQHAKAGNLNNALAQSSGELVVVFDTDHIPVTTFLNKTVPHFTDQKIGFVQTAHNFYNPDIFQKAFGTELLVPNEAEMFNRGLLARRSHWNGTFFVGSGAVFRRKALMQTGGFILMSITEDIHTSQHLHAKGWRSRYVSGVLAVGLTAENLHSYLVQRQRWMQGALQIFFKDNPLLKGGLGIRQRLSYFGSLFYFLYPLPRFIFWIAPLLFLLFHLHPIISEVSVLSAYLLPYMIFMPLIPKVLMPKWPRMLWGVTYENLIGFQLFF